MNQVWKLRNGRFDHVPESFQHGEVDVASLVLISVNEDHLREKSLTSATPLPPNWVDWAAKTRFATLQGTEGPAA